MHINGTINQEEFLSKKVIDLSKHDEEYMQMLVKLTVQELAPQWEKGFLEKIPSIVEEITNRICKRYEASLKKDMGNALHVNFDDHNSVADLQDVMNYARKQRDARDNNILTARQIFMSKVINGFFYIFFMGLALMMYKALEFYSEYGTFFFAND